MKLLPPEKYADANNSVSVIAPDDFEQELRDSGFDEQAVESMLTRYKQIVADCENTK